MDGAKKNKTIIIIAGPTATGKTAAAIELAEHFDTEIISADSRQCYKELNIGVACPSEEELKKVNHYFIASHSIHEKITAATFEQYALEKVNEIFHRRNIAVMVGGTGLYIKAFCEGLDEIPVVPELIRNEIIETYKKKGIEWLQQQIKQFDESFFKTAEIQNPHRLMRALEVYKATGRSILEFRKGVKAKRNFTVVKIALELPKEQLDNNINTRVDKMLANGLLEETRSLFAYQHLNALQTVGYKELFNYFNGKTSLEEAIALIKKNTKQYAKRQLTWFKKDKEYNWMKPDTEKLRAFIINLRPATE